MKGIDWIQSQAFHYPYFLVKFRVLKWELCFLGYKYNIQIMHNNLVKFLIAVILSFAYIASFCFGILVQ